MDALETLARQASHRDAWLRAIVQRLSKDGRFIASWLVGSLGRGNADGLSDIDIVVVISDWCAEDVLAHSVQEVARFGDAVWLREIGGNAPRGGAYVSAGFQSIPLPIAVDWYWQPLSNAFFPNDAQLLFHKAPVRAAAPPASFAELMSRPKFQAGTDTDQRTPSSFDRVSFFWAMVPVAAKYGVRGWDEKVGPILRGLEEQVDSVSASLAARRTKVPTAAPLTQLRQLVDEMDHLMPTLRVAGIPPPDTSYAHAFLSLAEDLKREGWTGSAAPPAN
jgi:predicted nucleotidyltransferase